jgi:RNA recognition motif-containing protein
MIRKHEDSKGKCVVDINALTLILAFRCGFVEFDTEEATEQAIHLNGRMVLGQPIRVDYSTPKDGPRESKSDSGRNTGNYDSSNMMNSYSGSGGMNDSSNYYGGNVPSTNYDQSNNPAAFGLANNNATLSALLSSLTGGSGGAHPTNQ